MTKPEYQLFYWPEIQGRGEFVRLVPEDADVPYVEAPQVPETEAEAVQILMDVLTRSDISPHPFAPPVLQHGDVFISQTAAICAYMGKRHGLAPDNDARCWP